MTYLLTQRLIIRRIIDSDWQAIKRIWENEKLSPYARYDQPNDTGDDAVRDRIAKWASFADGTEHMFFAVCLAETVIGYAAFNKRSDGYEIGYCFHSDYHRNGYAKESLSALLNALSGEGIHRFTVRTALNNAPSVALVRSLGFQLIETEQVSFYQDANGADILFDGGIFELRILTH